MTAKKIGRSAVDGRYTTVATAKAHPRTHIVETVRRGSKKRR